MDGLSSVDVLAEVFIAVCFVEFHFLFLDVHLFIYIILYIFFDAKDFIFSLSSLCSSPLWLCCRCLWLTLRFVVLPLVVLQGRF